MRVQWETCKYYERHTDDILPDLAKALKAGSLCLMVGSGVSSKLDLPLWHELVAACCDRAPTPVEKSGLDDQTTGERLLLRMQRVRDAFADDTKYLSAVSEELYRKWSNPAIAKAPELMRAIGVLAMGSVRGRVKTIVNFNFDS